MRQIPNYNMNNEDEGVNAHIYITIDYTKRYQRHNNNIELHAVVCRPSLLSIHTKIEQLSDNDGQNGVPF